jgi:hypothetical protein
MNLSTKYKHSENVIDIRDKNLVIWNSKRKFFITEQSYLDALGISARYTATRNSSGSFSKMIYLWSEKFETTIPYTRTSVVSDLDDTNQLEIYKPVSYFGSNQSKILEAYLNAQGTELHIINS